MFRSLSLIAIAVVALAAACCITFAPSADGQDNASYTDEQGLVYDIISQTADEKTASVSGYNGIYPSVAIPKKVTIDSVTYDVVSIGDNAFKSHYQLVSVTIPDSIVSIGRSAFEGCTQLESMSVPDSVTTIGASAFYGCSELESITLSKNIMAIGEQMLRYCSSLKSISIPSGVTFIGTRALSGCTELVSVDLPSGVTSIGEGAFSLNIQLRSVNIPDKVTYIGENAFLMCFNLTSVKLPAGITTIGSATFAYCSSLTSVNIPEKVTQIGGSAFKYCESLESVNIPAKVTEIGSDAFMGCASLVSVEIPANVTVIGDTAFYQCNSLKSIDVSPANGTYASVDGVLFDKNKTVLIQYPAAKADAEYQVPSGVKTIGTYAFNCALPTSVSLPATVTAIEEGAFNYCVALSSVKMAIPSSVTDIGDLAFNGCTALKTVSLPESVTNIGSAAFKDCTSLTSVTIPTGVQNIYKALFSGCISLTSVDLSSVAYISDEAFYCCSKLKTLNLPATLLSIGEKAFYGCSQLSALNIPANVTSIGFLAFQDCTALTAISVDSGSNYFSSADGVLFDKAATVLMDYPAGKTGSSYEIPSTVREIFDGAFQSSAHLTAVTIPASVTQIGSNVFWYCDSLAAINVDAGNNRYSSADGVLYDKGKTSLIQYPVAKQSSQFTVPDTVETIGFGAFYGCKNLQSVIIPQSVGHIDQDAFWNCSSLHSFKVDAGNDLYSSADGVLYNKQKTVLYTYPAAKADEEFLLLSSVSNIHDSAFYGCTFLKAINVDAGNNTYSSVDGVLFDKDQKTLVVYPAGKTGAEYRVPDGVLAIGAYAFSGNEYLESVHVPKSVMAYYGGAFYGCSSLKDLWLGAWYNLMNYDYAFELNGDTTQKVECTVWSLHNVAKGGLGSNHGDTTVFTYDEFKHDHKGKTDIPVVLIAAIGAIAVIAIAGVGLYIARSRKKEQ